MKTLLLLLASAASTLGALAPDSIAGRALRYDMFDGANRNSSAQTLLLGADGAFTSLYAAWGTPFIMTVPAYSSFIRPQANGTYTYARIDDTTGSLVLRRSDGSSETLSLEFTSSTGGGTTGLISHTFSLSDPAGIATSPVANISLRGVVDTAHPLIAGFVVPAPPAGSSTPAQREVLIRVVGPSLIPLGVTAVWADPDFKLFKGNTEFIARELRYSDWTVSPGSINVTAAEVQQCFQKLFTYAGAFPLLAASKDAVQFVRLDPGNYTVVATAAAGDAGGNALIEVYFLP